jgi:hypothetical protein
MASARVVNLEREGVMAKLNRKQFDEWWKELSEDEQKEFRDAAGGGGESSLAKTVEALQKEVAELKKGGKRKGALARFFDEE